MLPSVHLIPSIGLLLLTSCVGTTVPPALVLQVTQITRARTTDRAFDRRRELAFTAALSVGLGRVSTLPVDPQSLDPPQLHTDAIRCEPFDSTICVWVRAAEESAWLAALEDAELPP